MRVCRSSAHRHLRIGQEVLHRDGLAGKASLIELILHEFRRRDDQIDLVI